MGEFVPSLAAAHISETKARFIATTGLHPEPGTINTFVLHANQELRIPVSAFRDRVLYLRFRNPAKQAVNCNMSVGESTHEFYTDPHCHYFNEWITASLIYDHTIDTNRYNPRKVVSEHGFGFGFNFQKTDELLIRNGECEIRFGIGFYDRQYPNNSNIPENRILE